MDERALACTGAAEQRGDARSRCTELCLEQELPALQARSYLEHAQRPSRCRSERASSSATSSPDSPRAKLINAMRAAMASPLGLCNAEYSAMGSVCVTPGILPAKVMTAPNSPRLATSAVTAPARIPGAMSGRVTV